MIEDEPQIQRFLRPTLIGQGYRVVEAATGEEGVIQAATRQPDIVILDLGLPDMDGLEVIRQLREWTCIPVIVLSARGQERDKIAALDAGADDYVAKPFAVGELLARMRVALRHAAQSSREPTDSTLPSTRGRSGWPPPSQKKSGGAAELGADGAARQFLQPRDEPESLTLRDSITQEGRTSSRPEKKDAPVVRLGCAAVLNDVPTLRETSSLRSRAGGTHDRHATPHTLIEDSKSCQGLK